MNHFPVKRIMSTGADQLEFLISPRVEFISETAVLIQKARNVFDAQAFCKFNKAQLYQPKSVINYDILKQFATQHRIFSFWIGISDHLSKGTLTISLQKSFMHILIFFLNMYSAKLVTNKKT